MKKILILLTIVALSFSSCKRIDFGDINVDPSVPREGDIDGLMRGAMVNFSTGSGRVYYSNATLYAQYQSQTIYTQEQRYVQYKGSFYAYYVNQLSNLDEVYRTMNDPKLRGSTDNMRAIAKLMSILIIKRVTDTYGDIPYFDALQGFTDLTPEYTSQKDIYLDLLTQAKDARDLLNPAAFTPDADTDIFYAGDISKWGKFANSLILALSLQISNTPEAPVAKAAYQEALTNAYGFMEDASDDMVFTPDPRGKVFNPISSSRPGDFKVTKELVDALKGTNPETWGPAITDPKNITSNHTQDLRLVAMVNDPTKDGLAFGYKSYPKPIRTAAAAMNGKLNSEDSPFVIFTAAYTWLNRAEGVLLGWNTSDTFNNALTRGIEESYKRFFDSYSPANQAAALSYASGTYAPARVADAVGKEAQVLGEEKWFALFPDGFAAWAEQRRTGWPALHPAPEAVNGGVIPHRMLYPDNERNVNPEGWAQGVQGLTPADDQNTSKIWWELP